MLGGGVSNLVLDVASDYLIFLSVRYSTEMIPQPFLAPIGNVGVSPDRELQCAGLAGAE